MGIAKDATSHLKAVYMSTIHIASRHVPGLQQAALYSVPGGNFPVRCDRNQIKGLR